jgi:hypothetical protein
VVLHAVAAVEALLMEEAAVAPMVEPVLTAAAATNLLNQPISRGSDVKSGPLFFPNEPFATDALLTATLLVSKGSNIESPALRDFLFRHTESPG